MQNTVNQRIVSFINKLIYYFTFNFFSKIKIILKMKSAEKICEM
jgi:hypothetical protein